MLLTEFDEKIKNITNEYFNEHFNIDPCLTSVDFSLDERGQVFFQIRLLLDPENTIITSGEIVLGSGIAVLNEEDETFYVVEGNFFPEYETLVGINDGEAGTLENYVEIYKSHVIDWKISKCLYKNLIKDLKEND